MLLKRFKDNPILKPEFEWEINGAFNPCVVQNKNKIIMLYRGMDSDYISHIGCAESIDGIHFKKNKKPLVELKEDYEKYGMEDPRIIKLEGKFYITYIILAEPPFSGKNNLPQTAVMYTKDFKNFTRIGKITSKGANDKDVLIFPEKIRGHYYFIHRPDQWTGAGYKTCAPSIWISHTEKFEKLWHPTLLLRPESKWEEYKVGGGCPPIKTKKGWICIYHGITKDLTYSAGAFLLDLNNPRKVIAKLKKPILRAQEDYEKTSDGKWVVFPTGAIVLNDQLFVYYGAGDRFSCLATCKLDELLKQLMKSPYKEKDGEIIC